MGKHSGSLIFQTGSGVDNAALVAALAAKLDKVGGTLTGALAVMPGSLATAGLRLAQTWSGGAGTTHRGMEVAITATAGQFAMASSLFRVLGGPAGATERMVLAEDGMAVIATGSSGRVLDLTSQYGTATFTVGGGGAIRINSCFQAFGNGISAFQSGNAANGVFLGWDAARSLPYINPSGSTLQIGIGAAAPIAYTIHGASTRAGVDVDAAGAPLIFGGGVGTGAGGGGKLIFQTAPSGSSGATANTLTTALEIDRNRVLFVANASAGPSGTPSGGGFFYVEAGALKYKGSSGTVTTLASA